MYRLLTMILIGIFLCGCTLKNVSDNLDLYENSNKDFSDSVDSTETIELVQDSVSIVDISSIKDEMLIDNNLDDELEFDISTRIEYDLEMLIQNSDFVCDEALIHTYIDVLTSKESFCDEDSEDHVYLKDMEYSGYSLTPILYTLNDMDNDNEPELVLVTTLGAVDFVIVFHVYDNEVQSHWFSHKEMSAIKLDGTYVASGGAGDWGFYRIEFVDDGYIGYNVGHMESKKDKEHNYTTVYCIE